VFLPLCGINSAQDTGNADHTWAAIEEYLNSKVALTKHWTDAAFQKLRCAWHDPDQTFTGFGAYIVKTHKGTDITINNK
jgi:hypothetical protein